MGINNLLLKKTDLTWIHSKYLNAHKHLPQHKAQLLDSATVNQILNAHGSVDNSKEHRQNKHNCLNVPDFLLGLCLSYSLMTRNSFPTKYIQACSPSSKAKLFATSFSSCLLKGKELIHSVADDDYNFRFPKEQTTQQFLFSVMCFPWSNFCQMKSSVWYCVIFTIYL